MLTKTRNRPEYDLPTAVTFLCAGLALGWILARLFSPRAQDSAPRPASMAHPLSVADEVFFG
jgi:hypothetical protein